jgi:AcrR family transcriptional regulator
MAASKSVLAKTPPFMSSRDRLREAAKTLFAEHGFEDTSTAAICRLAGTSQSQLTKHFTNKLGLLQAIFEYAWEQINPAVRLATESIASPREQLTVLIDMVLGFLEKDRALRTTFLLEGRRIRGSQAMVALVPGFLEFIKMVDGIFKELAARGDLAPHVRRQALRSAVMGAIEGMLRDQMLARTSGFPATYTEKDMRVVVNTFLSACLSK